MVKIRTFRPSDSESARNLFSQGQMDFAAGLEEPVQRYIDLSLSADLADIPRHYLTESGSHFWVAEVRGAVQGMVGVQRRSEEEGELRRMSVAAGARRQGIGWKLLEAVEAFCREQGYHRIALSTVNYLQPAMAMYLKFGFRLVDQKPYDVFTEYFFVKELAPPKNSGGGRS